jgi:hypothetical protein
VSSSHRFSFWWWQANAREIPSGMGCVRAWIKHTAHNVSLAIMPMITCIASVWPAFKTLLTAFFEHGRVAASRVSAAAAGTVSEATMAGAGTALIGSASLGPQARPQAVCSVREDALAQLIRHRAHAGAEGNNSTTAWAWSAASSTD